MTIQNNKGPKSSLTLASSIEKKISVEDSNQFASLSIGKVESVTGPTSGLVNLYAPQNLRSSNNGILNFFSGCISGALARAATNSPRDLASHLQSGASRSSFDFSRCISIRNLTAGTSGTAMLYATTYGSKALLENPNDSAQIKALKNGACGMLGGLVIHPSNIAFFHQQSDHKLSGRQNFQRLFKCVPSDFKRGIPARLVASGSQWGVFFTVRDILKEKGFSDSSAISLAGLSSVTVCTPFHQAYANQCRTGEYFKSTVINM